MALRNRPACTDDLKAYFKKSDLLGGLTSIEYEELRKNIGVPDFIGEGLQLEPESISYEELLIKQKAGSIVVGGRYIINNFQTIYYSNNNETWGKEVNPSPIYQLLVIGNTSNSFDSVAYVLGKPWVVKYDFTQETLPGNVKTKGKITYLKDEKGNSAYYDFKAVKFRRTRSELQNTTVSVTQPYIDLYTFSTIDSTNNVLDASEINVLCEYNEIKENCWNNVFIGDTYNNIFQQEFINNTFVRGCNNSHFLWNTQNNKFHDVVTMTTGAINNKDVGLGIPNFTLSITKQIHKVNDATILTYLDPITYAQQIIIL